MAFLFQKEKKKFLSLDIGSEAVKGVLFAENNNDIIIEKAALSYFEKFGVFETADFEKDVFRRAITQCLEQLCGKNEKIQQSYISLPEHNIKEAILAYQLSRQDAGQRIEKSEKAKIYKEATAQAENQAILKFFGPEAKISFLEKKIVESKINGYKVADIEGYKGEIVELKIYLAFAQSEYADHINDYFSGFNWKSNSFVSVNSVILDNFQTEKSTALFLDIGGETTKILAFKSGSPYFVGEFEAGGKAITGRIAELLAMGQSSSRDFKHRYCAGELAPETVQKVKTVIEPTVAAWTFDLKKFLEEEKLRPVKIFLFGGGSLCPDIPEILKKNWPGALISYLNRQNFKSLPLADEKNIHFAQFLPAIANCLYARRKNI